MNILCVIVLFSSCNQEVQDFDQKVYEDILTDFIEIDKYYKPAPQPELVNENQIIANAKVIEGEYDIKLQEYFRKLDTINIYLYINDNLKAISFEEIKGFIEKYTEIKEISQKNLNQKPLNLESFNSENIELIGYSFFSSDSLFNSIGFIGDELFIGYLTLTRILFNDKKTEGILIGDFICGNKCGERFLIWTTKENDKWIIKDRFIIAVY